MKTWERKSDFEILFKDSPDYFGVKNAGMILNPDYVIFHVFEGDKYLRQEVYPSRNIHRIKILPLEQELGYSFADFKAFKAART